MEEAKGREACIFASAYTSSYSFNVVLLEAVETTVQIMYKHLAEPKHKDN